MERNIGEIFKYKGEWYQCIKSNGSCADCVGFDKSYDFCRGFDGCTGKIFKKIHKTGKPFSDYCPDGRIAYFQRYECYQKPIVNENIIWNLVDDTMIDIEIEQNKEDMEEKNFSLKPFDLQKAIEGKPVCTRDGRKARVICFDGKGDQPIIALVEAKGNKDALIEKVERYFINGHSVFEVRETNNDLMMLPEKKEGWVNVYKSGLLDTKVYNTRQEAFEKASQQDYVATVEIEWEE